MWNRVLLAPQLAIITKQSQLPVQTKFNKLKLLKRIQLKKIDVNINKSIVPFSLEGEMPK